GGRGGGGGGRVGGAARARAGAAGALLAPGLRASAGDEPAAFRGAGTAPARVQLCTHGLVDDVRLHVGREHRLFEGDVLLGGSAEQRRLGRGHYASSRTSTNPFFGPGTAPLTNRRLRSASTSWTTRPTWVTRSPPSRPAMRTPLKTRDGVADAPIEPGLRMLCEPCDFGPRWNLCRLIVPAKPFPCETPLTFTFSPGANASTVTFSPTTSSLSPRNSTSRRYAPSTSFAFRWPSAALVSLRSATLSYAICTAS